MEKTRSLGEATPSAKKLEGDAMVLSTLKLKRTAPVLRFGFSSVVKERDSSAIKGQHEDLPDESHLEPADEHTHEPVNVHGHDCRGEAKVNTSNRREWGWTSPYGCSVVDNDIDPTLAPVRSLTSKERRGLRGIDPPRLVFGARATRNRGILGQMLVRERLSRHSAELGKKLPHRGGWRRGETFAKLTLSATDGSVKCKLACMGDGDTIAIRPVKIAAI